MAARITDYVEGGHNKDSGFGDPDHPINLPSFNTGDLVLCFMRFMDDSGAWPGTPPTGWSTLDAEETWNMWDWIGYRQITGSEGYVGDGSDTIIYELADCYSAYMTVTVTGHDRTSPPLGSLSPYVSEAGNKWPDPPNVAFIEPGEHLVIATCFMSISDLPVLYPSNYDDDQHTFIRSVGFGDQAQSIASRLVDGSSENPGVFTLPYQSAWTPGTVAIASQRNIGGGFGAFGL